MNIPYKIIALTALLLAPLAALHAADDATARRQTQHRLPPRR